MVDSPNSVTSDIIDSFFNLTKNFPGDVECALAEKSMTTSIICFHNCQSSICFKEISNHK